MSHVIWGVPVNGYNIDELDNIFFLFQETPVNTNIQVIEASGRGTWWAY